MAGRFVFVINTFIGDTVDNFYRLFVNSLGGGFIACFDSFQHLLNRSTESGTQAGVVGALFNRLAGTFVRCLPY